MYFCSSTISTRRWNPNMVSSEGSSCMPQVSRNHATVSAPVRQFFSPSSDVLHRCILAQKETSPSMVSSLASGVEYKSFMTTSRQTTQPTARYETCSNHTKAHRQQCPMLCLFHIDTNHDQTCLRGFLTTRPHLHSGIKFYPQREIVVQNQSLPLTFGRRTANLIHDASWKFLLLLRLRTQAQHLTCAW